MEALINYLSELNAEDNQWGVYVDPEDYAYRIGQTIFENGGMLDGKIYVGTLEELSFGFQSEGDAFGEAAAEAMGKSRFNEDGLYQAFVNEELPEELQSSIEKSIEIITSMQAREQAEKFVYEQMPEIFEAAQQLEVA